MVYMNMKTTKDSRFPHKKVQSNSFDDGTVAVYSGDIQLLSLITLMQSHNHSLVYSDSSVFFRNPQNVVVSFENACKLHNAYKSNDKIVERVKLQRSGSTIKTLCNKIMFTPAGVLSHRQTSFLIAQRIGKFPTVFDHWKFVALSLLVQKD